MQSFTWKQVSLAVLAAQLMSAGPVLPGETEFRVKLLSPLSTSTNKKGDRLTAQVIYPDAFRGDVMEGKVNEAKGGAKVKGKAILNFSFDTLNHQGRPVPVQSSVKSVINSKGQQDVDEEGRIVKKKNNLGKAAVVTGLGALVGGLAGGAKGAAIGAGAGAAAALIFIEIGVQGANVDFAAGSEFVLTTKERR